MKAKKYQRMWRKVHAEHAIVIATHEAHDVVLRRIESELRATYQDCDGYPTVLDLLDWHKFAEAALLALLASDCAVSSNRAR